MMPSKHGLTGEAAGYRYCPISSTEPPRGLQKRKDMVRFKVSKTQGHLLRNGNTQ